MILELRGLAVGHRGTPALTGVDLTVRPGESWALVGPNGAGKTTLLRTVAGLLNPLAGSMTWDGGPPPRSATERARTVAYMAQEEPAAFPVPVRETVLLGRFARTGAWREGPGDRERVEEALRAADADGLADRPLDRLSGGERQRARYARMLAQDAPVRVLDEPSAALDAEHALRVADDLRAHVANGGSAIVAIHDLSLALRAATHLLLVGEGEVAAAGPAEEVAQSDAMERVYRTRFARVRVEDRLLVVPISGSR